MKVIQQIKADLNGEGSLETLNSAYDPNGTLITVIQDSDGNQLWYHQGPIDGWNRQPEDDFIAAVDFDGDNFDEVIVYNPTDNYTGVFKWAAGALHCPWASPSPIDGWNRSSDDILLPARLEAGNQEQILIYRDSDQWTGVLQWSNGLRVAWASQGPIDGFVRSPADQFVVIDIDQDGIDEAIVANSGDGWLGVLKWSAGSLHNIWASSNFNGPYGDWSLELGDVIYGRTIGNRNCVLIVRLDSDRAGIPMFALGWQNNGLVTLPPTLWPNDYPQASNSSHRGDHLLGQDVPVAPGSPGE